jgi:RNA polymerase sigma-70 factor, ECF subfamily
MRDDVAQALEIYQQQSHDSLERAVALLQHTVFAFSMKACGHPEDAEDTMQDVLVKTVRYLGGFRDARALTVWLYKVARNTCLAHRRRPQSAPFLDLSLDALMPDEREMSLLLSTKLPDPEHQAAARETADLLERAVRELPDTHRAILVLHDMEGLNHSEIAEVIGLAEGTVRVRLHRARLHVRRILTSHMLGIQEGAGREKSAKASQKHKHCRDLFARLSDYIDGVLEDDFCAQMQKHLSDCEPCLAFLASLEHVVKLCRLYQPHHSSERAEQLRHRLTSEYDSARQALACCSTEARD